MQTIYHEPAKALTGIIESCGFFWDGTEWVTAPTHVAATESAALTPMVSAYIVDTSAVPSVGGCGRINVIWFDGDSVVDQTSEPSCDDPFLFAIDGSGPMEPTEDGSYPIGSFGEAVSGSSSDHVRAIVKDELCQRRVVRMAGCGQQSCSGGCNEC